MMNLKQLLNKPLKPISNKVVIFLLVVALLGFIDAGYLTVEHYKGVIPPCSITSGCEEVLTSSYSNIFGIPVSLIGMIYYLLVLIGVFGYLENKNHSMLLGALILTIPAFIASLGFVYIQVFTIGSYCIYCLGSFLTSTILFVTAMEIFSKHEQY